jgi:hypothetical protein
MMGPNELMVIMIIMLVVAVFGGGGPGPRPPGLRRLQLRMEIRRPLFGRLCPNIGVRAYTHTPFCYYKILYYPVVATLPRSVSYATILCMVYEI